MGHSNRRERVTDRLRRLEMVHELSTDGRLRRLLSLCNKDKPSIKLLVDKLMPIVALFNRAKNLRPAVRRLLTSVKNYSRSQWGRKFDLYQILRKAGITRSELDQDRVRKIVKEQLILIWHADKISAARDKPKEKNNLRSSVNQWINDHKDIILDVLENNLDEHLLKQKQFRDLDCDIFDVRRGLIGDHGPRSLAFQQRKFREYLRMWDRPMSVATLADDYPNFILHHGARFAELESSMVSDQTPSKLKTLVIRLGEKATYLNNGNGLNLINRRRDGIRPLPQCHSTTLWQEKPTSLDDVVKYYRRKTDFYLLCYRIRCNSSGIDLQPVTKIQNANMFIFLRKKGGKFAGQLVVPEDRFNQMLSQDKRYVLEVHALAYKIWHGIERATHHTWVVSPNVFGLHYKCISRKQWNKKRKQTCWYPYKGQCLFDRYDVMKNECFIKLDPLHILPRVKDFLDLQRDFDISKLKPYSTNASDYHVLLPLKVVQFQYMGLPPKFSDYNKNEYLDMLNRGTFGVCHKVKWRLKHFGYYCYSFASSKKARGDLSTKRKEGKGIRIVEGDEGREEVLYECDIRNMEELGLITDREKDFNMVAANLYKGMKASEIKPHKDDKFSGRVLSATWGEPSFLAIGMGVQGYNSGITAIPTGNGTLISYEFGGLAMNLQISHSVLESHLLWNTRAWRLSKLYRFVTEENQKQAQAHLESRTPKCKKNKVNRKVCECVEIHAGPFDCNVDY